jgi:iron complex transport system ATP-binding protein
MSSALIQIKSLEIGYRNKAGASLRLLPPINLLLHAGDFIALMGPNGAGKSTLIRTIAGMHPALAGSILFQNISIDALDKREQSRLVGIVLTDRIEDFFLTVYDVVSMGRYPYTGFWGKLSPDDHQSVLKSLKMVGITSLADRTMISLSDGERQKVMIAKALAQDTPVILLDEPAAYLDYPSKIELMHLLQQLAHDDGKTILFSSHDLDLALNSADRLWLIGRDKPVQDGIPEQLVLDGCIGDYFNRNSLVFDKESGKFPNKKPTGIRIQVVGEGTESQWLKHAIIRKGYWLADETSDAQVHVESRSYKLVIQNKERIFTNQIEDILYELSKL